MGTKRIKWIDTAKFIGIFAIYLGHFAEAAGLSYKFVFTFHVPLFFFISGCMECYSNDIKFIDLLKKKINALLIPFYFFSFFSIFIYAIRANADINSIASLLILVINGAVRNTFFASSLWFLTCLFIVQIIFSFIKKTNKYLIALISMFLYMIVNIMLVPAPISSPSWVYNIDSAFHYLIFYSAGYIMFPMIISLFKLDNTNKKIIFIVTGVIALLYSILLFFGKDIFVFMPNHEVTSIIINVIRPLILIWLIFEISLLCSNIKLMSNIGTNTLYLCGSEYIIKILFLTILEIIGVNLQLPNPLATYIYTFILIVTANKYLIPIEKKVLSRFKI